jgi:hypothetical protein
MDRQPVPLANRQQQLSGSVEPSASSTRQTPVYRLHLGGAPKIDWREALQPYARLQSVPTPAQASNKRLRLLQAQLRQRPASYLAPTWPFTNYICIPAPGPCWIPLTTRFAREQPASPYLPRLRELLDQPSTLVVGTLAPDFTLADLPG